MIKKIIYKLVYKFNILINMLNADALKNIDIDSFTHIILLDNNIGWENIMRQRPQQIASNFPANVLFLYHSNRDKYPDSKQFVKFKNNLYLLNFDLYRGKLFKLLKHYENKYLMIYSTAFSNIGLLNNYVNNGFKIIYEYVDDLSEKLNGKNANMKLKKVYDYIIKSDSYIICTATKLFDNVRRDNPKAKCRLITNGVDYNHFSGENYTIPKDLNRVIRKKKKIIGYYGALASWFDYELIKKISKLNTYEIVLLGIKYDDSYDKSGISSLNNVHFLGKKDYDELPNYAKQFDICIIPFLKNEITMSTSPVKLFEYMAAGKPIVTTDLPECRKYSSVLIGKNHQEFIDRLSEALSLKKNKDYTKKLEEEALNNTWESKCSSIINFIKEVR